MTAAFANDDTVMAAFLDNHAGAVAMTPAIVIAMIAMLLDDDGLRTGGGARRRQREAEGSQSSK